MKEDIIYTIDATDRTIGRIATEVATVLMGKNKPDFQKNTKPVNKVNLVNVSKAKIPFKKLTDKKYHWHTHHPGGYNEIRLGKLIDDKGYGEVFKKAVYGMLPKNKLRALMLKNLTITD